MNQTVTSDAVLFAVSASSLPSFGRASRPPRGLGAKPPNVVIRGVAPAPMLAQPLKHRSPKLSKTPSNETNKGTQLNKTDQQKKHTLSPKLRLLPLFLITTLCLVSSACSSQRHKKTSLVNLLNAEETLLHSIEAQRSTKSIKQRLERDQTLLEAEWHLHEAIRALFEANHAVKKSL